MTLVHVDLLHRSSVVWTLPKMVSNTCSNNSQSMLVTERDSLSVMYCCAFQKPTPVIHTPRQSVVLAVPMPTIQPRAGIGVLQAVPGRQHRPTAVMPQLLRLDDNQYSNISPLHVSGYSCFFFLVSKIHVH